MLFSRAVPLGQGWAWCRARANVVLACSARTQAAWAPNGAEGEIILLDDLSAVRYIDGARFVASGQHYDVFM